MGSGIVDGDHHVESRDLRRENIDVSELIDRAIDEDRRVCRSRLILEVIVIAILQAHPLDIFALEERSQERQINRAVVAGLLVSGIPSQPDQAPAISVAGAKLVARSRIGEQVGRSRSRKSAAACPENTS